MHTLVRPFGLDDPADRRKGGLRRGVHREQGRGFAEHAPAGDVDDVAVAALEHAGRQRAYQSQRRVVVEAHRAFDVVPALERVGQWAANGSARVVDEDVHAADLLLDAGGERIDGVEVGEIAVYGQRVTAVGDYSFGNLVEQVSAAGDHDDGRAPTRQLVGGGL